MPATCAQAPPVHQTRFTANANQSNESVTCAYVADTEVCACHRGENSFLPTWKLIFTTLEFYRECQPMKRALPGKLRAYLEIIARCFTWLGTSLVPRDQTGRARMQIVIPAPRLNNLGTRPQKRSSLGTVYGFRLRQYGHANL